jgi:2-polyprenyl-6-methoxyphenol hydroxylase-like FAD-dependent oxidoreductase
MGVLPDLLKAGYRVREVRIVDGHGHRRGGFDAAVFREVAFGRYTTIARTDLGAVLFDAIKSRVETRFGDSITHLEDGADGVLVRFEHAPPRRFDLVVGADGQHSTVRRLAFGPETRFEKFLGQTVAAFEIDGYPHRDQDVYVAYAAPGRQIARFALRGDRTLFLCVFAEGSAGAVVGREPAGLREYVRAQLSGLGWECRAIAASLERSEELYVDRVSQIRMEHWTKGRIALVGDAAYAPSLLAGQGSALALIGSYVLAGELGRADHVAEAFARYEALLQPFIRHKQKAAQGFAGSFAPKTQLGIFVRNQITKLFHARRLAKLAFSRSLLDHIQLPRYEETPRPP